MKFQPKPLPTLVCFLLFAVMVGLGFWQLSRYHFKKSLLKEYHQSMVQKPITLTELEQKKHKDFQHVAIKGRFLNGKHFLLQNRYYQNQLGFEVISPFQVAATKKILLVNRGWVPATETLTLKNPIKAIRGRQIMTGFVRYPPHHVFTLGKNIIEKKQWPLKMQKIDLAQIQTILKQPVYPFLIYLDKNARHGFVREWKPTVMLPQRHFGYMIQWFVMALALLIAYFAFSCKRNES